MKALLLSLLLTLPLSAPASSDYSSLFAKARYTELLQQLERDPVAQQDPELMLLRARALIQQQFREEANTLLNELIQQFPEHSALLTQAALNKIALANSGNIFNARKRATDGLALLQKAITLDPQNYLARQALINFYQVAPATAGGSKTLALELTEQLFVENPVQGTLARASNAVAEGRLSDALALLDAQLLQTPDNTELLLRKAAILTQQSAFLVAQQTYLQLQPLLTDEISRHNVNFQLGRLAVFTEHYQAEGIQALEAYLAFYDGSQQLRLPRAKLRLAQLYLRQGDKVRANALYQQIARMVIEDPDFIEARTQLAAQLSR
jgi:tetratricopeptide (TPR) repeat protein